MHVVVGTVPGVAITFLGTAACVLRGLAVKVLALDVPRVVPLDEGLGTHVGAAKTCFACAGVQVDI